MDVNDTRRRGTRLAQTRVAGAPTFRNLVRRELEVAGFDVVEVGTEGPEVEVLLEDGTVICLRLYDGDEVVSRARTVWVPIARIADLPQIAADEVLARRDHG